MPVVNDKQIKNAIARCDKSLKYLASTWREDLKNKYVKPDEQSLESRIKLVRIALTHYDVFSEDNTLTLPEIQNVIDQTREFGKICLCGEVDSEFSSGTGYLKSELDQYITIGGFRIII
jgi:hypothetical protein